MRVSKLHWFTEVSQKASLSSVFYISDVTNLHSFQIFLTALLVQSVDDGHISLVYVKCSSFDSYKKRSTTSVYLI
jgi:hypothetical protein